MKQLLETLAKCLNDTTINQHLIYIGRYKGEYYCGDGEYKDIIGDIYIRINYDTLFRVVSDDGIIDDFDILSYNATIMPAKDIESADVYLLESWVEILDSKALRRIFSDDEIGEEMFKCIQSIPNRFRADALDVFHDRDNKEMWNSIKTVNKAYEYFLSDIIDEMTTEEKQKCVVTI